MLEIEELANSVDGKCQVRGSGCLGLCNQAPNAVVVPRSKTAGTEPKYHTRIDTLAKSAALVLSATGKQPRMEDPQVEKRLVGVRAMREKDFAITVYRWNDALKAVKKQIAQDDSDPADMGPYMALVRTQQELFARAGYPAGGPPKSLVVQGRSPEPEVSPCEREPEP